MKRYLIMVVMLWGFSTLAMAQDVLTVDRSVSGDVETFFENKEDIVPHRSDFKVVNYVLMSSERGARWAVVTLKNRSTGSRIFQENHMLALFADGERRSPMAHSRTFKSLETLSLTLSFGRSAFPILSIYTRN